MKRLKLTAKNNIQAIKELAAKRDAICKEMADLVEADRRNQGGEAYKRKFADLVEVLNQITLLTPYIVPSDATVH